MRGTSGFCKCANGFRMPDCSVACPRFNGKVCGGKGACTQMGKCVCYGSYGGKSCELANRDVKLRTLTSAHAHHTGTAEAKKKFSSEVLSIVATAVSESKSRFQVMAIKSRGDGKHGETITLRVIDNGSHKAPAPTPSVQRATAEIAPVPRTELVGLLGSAASSGKSVDAIVTQLTAESKNSKSVLTTTLGVESVEVEALSSGCDGANFWKCADGTCMPKADDTTAISSGGECCTFDDASGSNTHCPVSSAPWLTKCKATTTTGKYMCVSAAAGWRANLVLVVTAVCFAFLFGSDRA